MLSSNWSKALEPNIIQWLHEGFSQHSDAIPEIFNVNQSSSGVIRIHDSFDPAAIETSSEGATSPSLALQKGYESVTAPQIFKSKIPITEEYNTRVMYDDIKNAASGLGRAGVRTLNRFAYGIIFILGFTSSNTFYGDGQEIFSTVHTRPDGGSTWSNASTTGITLTETNLETAIIAMKQQVTGTGGKLAIGSGQITLVVPESLEKEAVIITGSTKRSGTPNNDLNWYLGKYSVLVSPWIGSDVTSISGTSGSDTAWFLVAQGDHRLTFTYEMRPSYKMWDDDDTDTMYTKIKFSGRAYWGSPRGVWGSKGDGADYSS